jgi:hypothetical protein
MELVLDKPPLMCDRAVLAVSLNMRRRANAMTLSVHKPTFAVYDSGSRITKDLDSVDLVWSASGRPFNHLLPIAV